MSHLTSEALDRLLSRDPDATVCLHGIRSKIIRGSGTAVAVVRLVAHLILEDVPMEDDEVPEELFLVLDLLMAHETMTLVNGHFDETMDQMMEIALERLTTEDGDT